MFILLQLQDLNYSLLFVGFRRLQNLERRILTALTFETAFRSSAAAYRRSEMEV